MPHRMSLRRRIGVMTLTACMMLAGCNFTKLAANQTVSVFHQGAAAFDKEHDADLARTSALGQLKLFEGLMEVVPENGELLLLASESFATFTFGFLEDDLEVFEEGDPAFEKSHARAVDFYGRALTYASAWMALEHEEWPAILDGPVDALEAHLATLEPEDAAGLFWCGFALGGSVNLQADDPAAVLNLPKVKALMTRVVELDEGIFHGGAHLVLGSAAASFAPALGGDPALAKAHFERAIELTGGRYLMTRVVYATYYHVRQSRDRDAWRALLEAVRDAPDDLWPEQRLSNTLAKIRADRWLAREDELFD